MLFLIVLAPAISADEYYEQGTNISFIETVRVNNAPSDAATANITITDEDNRVIVGFAAMTFDSTNKTFNYTLTDDKTQQNGKYERCVDATAFGQNSSECFDFWINPTGIEPSESRTNATTRSIYIMFAISIIFFLSFFFTTKAPVKWTFFALSFLFFLISLNIVFISLQDEIINPRLIGFFEGFTVISWVLYWFIAGFLIIVWLFAFLSTWIYNNNQKRLREYGMD